MHLYKENKRIKLIVIKTSGKTLPLDINTKGVYGRRKEYQTDTPNRLKKKKS